MRRSHPKLTPPRVLYVCGAAGAGAGPGAGAGAGALGPLPPLAALDASYKKLAELCTPTSLAGFWVRVV